MVPGQSAQIHEMQRQSQLKAAGWQEEHFIAQHTRIVNAFLCEKESNRDMSDML